MSAESHRFSVLIPAYNAETTLAETLDSVRAQTFTDWEVVLVDDGSVDRTAEVASRFAYLDDRIRHLTQENRGTAGAYNTAAQSARGAYLVILSADDLLLPDHLASFDRFIDANPGASVFSSDGYYLFDDGSRRRVHPDVGWRDPTGCSLTDLMKRCFYSVGAVFHRDVFASVGGFAEGMYAEDYLFWLTAVAMGSTHRYLDEPLSLHRVGDSAKSADHLSVRESDLGTIQAVVETGLLSDEELVHAERSIARLKRNIGLRRGLGSAVGRARAERIIAALRRGRGARGGAE